MRNFIKVIFLLSVILAVSVSFPGCGKDVSGLQNNPVTVVDKNGVERNYNLYIPEVRPGEKLPMLVYFHGVWSEGFKNIAVLKGYTGSPVAETGLIAFCRINKIALLEVLPSYSYNFMNIKAQGWSPFDKEISGIEKCIDVVAENFKIEPDNIYLAGISAGGVISHHLANRRPGRYKAILSHSQAYISEKNEVLPPSGTEEKFGVVICYTKGDYQDLKELCESSYKVYKEQGYNVVILRDLPPLSHKWSNSTNGRFWRLLLRTGSGH